LESHAEDARRVIGDGIGGIGQLLWQAATNEKAGDIPADTLADVGALLSELAAALAALHELEYGFRDGLGEEEKNKEESD
jgi:hypothetical protein